MTAGFLPRTGAVAFLALASAMLPSCGEESGTDGKTAASLSAGQQSATPKNADELLPALFDARDANTLDAAIAAARAGGVSEQAILEARFLFLVDEGDYTALAALAPEVIERGSRFRIEDSAIFSVPEDWMAVAEYIQALAALEQGDEAVFKKHITEAFWLSPRQAAAFGPHIERHRLEKTMAGLRVDLAQKLFTQTERRETSLAQLAGDAAHLVIHFWSPWSQECEAYLPDLVTTAEALREAGLPFLCLLAELSPQAVPDAELFRKKAGENSPATWLLDDEESPLGRLLRVQDLPTVVLLARDGSVLFNGHPSNDRFWEKLQAAAPGVSRPERDPGSFDETLLPAE